MPVVFPELSAQDWEWLKDRCSDYAEGDDRDAVLKSVRDSRPDLYPTLERMIADLQNAGDTGMISCLETWWFGREGPEKPNFAPGEVVSGRYCVKSYVGRGGMGEVYEVADQNLPERGSIALKTIRSDMSGDRVTASRFEHEIRNSLTVAHRNVCRIYDVGRYRRQDDAILYLTMEYLPGVTLAKWLKDRNVHTNPLSESEALPLIRQMAAGLAAIHATKVIHRDFKPGNVMLVRKDDGFRAVITDFGLSRAAGDGNTTQAGSAFGTPAWMAPELFSGEVTATPASDVYSLGLTMHEMLTGTRYEPGAPLTSLAKAPVSRHLRYVVRRCLERNPAARFADAAEVAKALDTETPAGRQAAKRWVIAGLGATLAIAATAASFVWSEAAPGRIPAEQRLVQEGARQVYSNSFYAATTVLEQAVAMDPHDAFALAMLAYGYNALDLTGKANREILKAVAENDVRHAPRDERIFIDAVHLTMAREYDRAAEKFQDYYSKGDASTKPDRAIVLGRALEIARKPVEAAAIYRRSPDRPAAQMLLAIFDSKQMRVAEARREFEGALSGFRNAGQFAAVDGVLLQYGGALGRWGLKGEEKEKLKTCVSLGEKSGDDYGRLRCKLYLLNIGFDDSSDKESLAASRLAMEDVVAETGRLGFQLLLGRAHVALGRAYGREGRVSAAELEWEKALTLAKSEEDLRLQAQVESVRAYLHYTSGRPDEAEAEARRALAFYDSDGSLANIANELGTLALALGAQGKTTQALALLDKRRASMPELPNSAKADLWQDSGVVYRDAENYPAALVEYRKAVQAGLSDAAHLSLMVEATMELGQLREAQTMLQRPELNRSLRGPLEAKLQQEKASIALYSGSTSAAERLLGKAQDRAGQTQLGVAKIRNGKAEEGIALCRSVLEAGSESPVDSSPRLCLLEGFVREKNRVAAQSLYDSIGHNWTPRSESAWRADALMAELAPSGEQFRRAAAAHLAELRLLWGDAAFLTYSSRRDVQNLMSEASLTGRR